MHAGHVVLHSAQGVTIRKTGGRQRDSSHVPVICAGLLYRPHPIVPSPPARAFGPSGPYHNRGPRTAEFTGRAVPYPMAYSCLNMHSDCPRRVEVKRVVVWKCSTCRVSIFMARVCFK